MRIEYGVDGRDQPAVIETQPTEVHVGHLGWRCALYEMLFRHSLTLVGLIVVVPKVSLEFCLG
jgi:hypothetical protein